MGGVEESVQMRCSSSEGKVELLVDLSFFPEFGFEAPLLLECCRGTSTQEVVSAAAHSHSHASTTDRSEHSVKTKQAPTAGSLLGDSVSHCYSVRSMPTPLNAVTAHIGGPASPKYFEKKSMTNAGYLSSIIAFLADRIRAST